MLFVNIFIALLTSASLAAGLAFPGGEGHGEYHGDKGKTCSAVYSTKYISGVAKSQYYETKTNEYPYPTEVTKTCTTSSACTYPITIYKPITRTKTYTKTYTSNETIPIKTYTLPALEKLNMTKQLHSHKLQAGHHHEDGDRYRGQD
ncbi:hypothetical protein G6514_005384 [Epicoccum nigrum]|nr:hypothetical protein G6514_005384 [Epicoccum nigrum]